MQDTLRRMQQKRANGERGFTLVELLVVVVIIGILVAIAIPLYLNYRKGAANKTAESDVRAAITAVEQYYAENGNTYPTTVATAATSTTGLVLGTQKATISPGNSLTYNLRTVAPNINTYYICGRNDDGGQVYIYDSAKGGSVGKSTQTTLATCQSSGT